MRPLLAAVLLALLIPAGASSAIRHDPARSLGGLELHDGSSAAPRTTTGLWRQLLFELRRDADATEALPAPRDLQAAALAAVGSDVVPVALLDVAYDRLPPGSSRDAGVPGEPRRAFAAAALRPTVYRGARTTFAWSPRWTVGDAPARVELDPGDGRGWRAFAADGRLDAAYARAGEVTVRLRATAADGTLRHAAFPLEIAALAAPLPDDTLHVTASVAWDGAAASGDAYVALAPGHAELTNPVLVVEGFDLDDTMDWDVLYELLNQENLIETLRAEGFDAVVLDFDTATEPIQRNGLLVAELIQQVDAMLPTYRTTALIGASMGGLCTRWALGWLEQQGVDHRVRTWISFDSPQRGAVIPLGIQHWLEFFEGDSESAAYLLSRLDTPAARQMLLQHHDATAGETAGADPLKAVLDAELAAYPPPSCRRVAACNGSGAMADQGFAAGAQIIRYEYRSFLVDITGNVWALPDGNRIRIFEGEKNLIWPLPDEYEDVYVSGTQSWDGAPGGRRASMAQMDTTSVPYGDIEALHDFHCFVPTVSALDLDGVGPWHDVLGDPDLLTRTPFEEVFVPAVNEDHISISAASAAWFLDQVREGVTGVDDAPATAARLAVHPNPFNPRTTVAFDLTAAGRVDLAAYDLRGRRVATLLAGPVAAGPRRVSWDGRADAGSRLPTGAYVLRLRTPSGTATSRVTLLE